MEYKDFLTFKHEKFNFWSNKVLPLVYDDSLSYYEVICKLAQYGEYMRNYFVNLFYLLEEQIASINEKEQDFASKNRDVGELVWINDCLYRVIHKIPAGNHYVVGENIESITIETLIKTGYKSIADYIETDDKTSSRENPTGTLIWYMGGLYECIKDIATGDAYVVNNNILKTTVEEQLKKIKLEIDRLEQKIDKEIQDRIDGDNALKDLIDKETQERKEADNQINTRIDNLVIEGGGGSTDLTDIYNQLNTEIQNRQDADNTLQGNIDTTNTNLNTEIQERKDADANLQTQIDNLKTSGGGTSDITISEITATQVDTWYNELVTDGTITSSEIATLDGTNEWTGANNFTSLTINNKQVATTDQLGTVDTSNLATLDGNNTFTGTTNNFTTSLQIGGVDVANVNQIPDTSTFANLQENNTWYGNQDFVNTPTVNNKPLASQAMVQQLIPYLKMSANEWSNTNDFKALTVHGEEYTPTYVSQLTGIDKYNFERIGFVGETIDLTLPTAAIANTYMNPEGIFSVDLTGTTATITGVSTGSCLLGLQTITGYTIEMNFYCKSAREATGKTICYTDIEGLTNGQIIQTGTSMTIYSRLYTNNSDNVSLLPGGDVGDIYINNSSSGVDGCTISFNHGETSWGNQSYDINGISYANMSRGAFTVNFTKPGIYTFEAFYVGMDNSENSPTVTQNEGLYTTVITVAVTDTGTNTIYDKINVGNRISYFEQMVAKFIEDYYTVHSLEMRGNSNTASSSNFMLASSKSPTTFTLETDFDISRLSVDEASKEYVTFDFANKNFTFIKSTTDSSPLGVTILLDGKSIGTAYVCFTTSKPCPSTNISYSVSEKRL